MINLKKSLCIIFCFNLFAYKTFANDHCPFLTKDIIINNIFVEGGSEFNHGDIGQYLRYWHLLQEGNHDLWRELLKSDSQAVIHNINDDPIYPDEKNVIEDSDNKGDRVYCHYIISNNTHSLTFTLYMQFSDMSVEQFNEEKLEQAKRESSLECEQAQSKPTCCLVIFAHYLRDCFAEWFKKGA